MTAFRLIALPAATAALAAQAFPLPASADDRTPLEATAPFLVPARMVQTKVTDRNTLLAQGLPYEFSQWDQMSFDPTGRYIFESSEQTLGAGVFRYDRATHAVVALMQGNASGVRNPDPATWDAANDDFRNLDPCLWTPWGTILTAEEADGGRLFEILNPLSPTGPYQVVWRDKVPSSSYEGIRIDSHGVLYCCDEDNSGSFYKFVPTVPGDLSAGQLFVLRVDAFANDQTAHPERNWDSSVNRHADGERFGLAHWIPLTDTAGNPLTTADPYAFVTSTGARLAADEVRATPFGRGEDMDINTLANGHECLYSCLTSENRVISIELVDASTAIVRVFVDFDTIDLATGHDVNPQQNDPYTPPGPGSTFNDPDNLAVDAFGNVYIVEDASPGDIWRAIDVDRDGVAEAIARVVSDGVLDGEPTGMIFDPTDPYRFLCTIQGPPSGNSAMWSFSTRPFPGSNRDIELQFGIDSMPITGPGTFVSSGPGGHNLIAKFASPNGTFTGAPFAIFFQLYPTTASPTPFLLPLWLVPNAPFNLLTYAAPPALPAGGYTTSVPIPLGIGGWNALLQGVAVANGAWVFTEAHELVLQ
jgi:hypothetical protein